MTTTSRPLRWIALGSLALMALSGAWADECPALVTVTKTETTTVWADGSWPTKTVTQLVVPDDCPPEPRHSCYVVQTTTLSAHMPQATIHMVLPQQESKQEWNAESKEEGQDDADEQRDVADAADQMVADTVPAPTITPALPTPTGPACVNYVTTLSMGPCPTFSVHPTNSEGCAIVTSTVLSMIAITAVPEVDVTYSYSYSIGHKHRKHPHKSTPAPTANAGPTPLPTPPPNALFPPAEQKDVESPTKTEFQTSFSTHYSYTLSFDFSYGTLAPSPVPGTPLAELPAPKTTTKTTTTSGSNDATKAPPTSTNPITPPSPEPADPADPNDPTIQESRLEVPPAVDPSVPSTPNESGTGPVTIEQPGPKPISKEIVPELSDENGTGPVTIEQPGPELLTSIVSDSPSPIVKKACQECAEPCIVELNIAAKAEIPLLAKLFEDKIKKALASLKLTLENEIGSSSVQDNDNNKKDGSVPTGLFAGLNVDVNITGLFRKTCEDKLDAIEKKHMETLSEKCERVIRTGCETGACLQSELDKAVKLLDAMISTELVRDCSQLRSEIVQEFKTRCDQDQKAKLIVNANMNVEKNGLVSGLLGEDNVVDKVVDGLGQTVNQVVSKTETPLTGIDLVERLVEGLTDTVKSVVDSFVGNCNRKGVLDFDTEKGVGALAAIADVSLNLFKIVCVHVQADAKVDASAQ
ncbi:hypothetical protein BGW39_007951 [Mortierella sp. 14UC]|nr:hypothetical protein BGW39_007951 [Mortierella sp. 14UC]